MGIVLPYALAMLGMQAGMSSVKKPNLVDPRSMGTDLRYTGGDVASDLSMLATKHTGAGNKRHHIDAQCVEGNDDCGRNDDKTGKPAQQFKNDIVHFIFGFMGNFLLKKMDSNHQKDFYWKGQRDDEQGMKDFFQDGDLGYPQQIGADYQQKA